MGKLMKESPYWKKKNLLFAFANSGKERFQTLDFIKRCDDEFGFKTIWVEAVINEYGDGTTHKIVNYETASRAGEPFEAMIKKYGIPNAAFPHCTRELKGNPLKSLAESIFGKDYVSAIGIRIDEARRIKKKEGILYPLLEYLTTFEDVRDFWNAQPFDLELKDYEGNCDWCWKKSLRKLLTLAKENPEIPQWWHGIEMRYGSKHLETRSQEVPPPYYFHRKNMSSFDLIEMAKGNFIPATDPFWKADRSNEMDTEQPCSCMNSEGDL